MQAGQKKSTEPSSDSKSTEQLRQYNLQNIDILESVTDAFAAFDSEWRFTYVNAAAERFLGAPREEIVGRNHWEMFPKTLGTVVEENYRRAAREGITIQFEFFYEHWNRWYSIRCYPGANGGLTNYFLDITEAKLAALELQRRNDALQKANRALEEFAYIASHDLQEPIRNILISTELLNEEMGAANEKAVRLSDGIRRAALGLERLVRDLLTYVRVIPADWGGSGVADLTVCFRQAVELMQPRISETGANITAAGLPVVQGDRVHLTQVFQNLLSNSLKYCRPDVTPRIEVSAQQDDSNWTITVRDNGIGFEPRHAERIFELFKRLHRENQYPGTGLGLAICRRIVERYGGQIWAEGKPGEGSAFHMKFLRGGGFDYLKDLSG